MSMYCQNFCVTLLGMALAFSSTGSLSAYTLLQDDFESYGSTSELNAVWNVPPTGAASPSIGSGVLDQSNGIPGKSLRFSVGSNQIAYVQRRRMPVDTPSDANPIVWQFDFFDDNGLGNKKITGGLWAICYEFKTFLSLLEMGVYNNLATGPNTPNVTAQGYGVRTALVGGDPDNWVSLEPQINPQIGWHHFKGTIGASYAQFELDMNRDGIADATRRVKLAGGSAMPYTDVRIGSPSNVATPNSGLSFDNLSITQNRQLSSEYPHCLKLDPKATFLKPTAGPDLVPSNFAQIKDPRIIDLQYDLPFAVSPGDWLRLRAIGKFNYTQATSPDPGPYGDGTLRDVFGVFSSSGDFVSLNSQSPDSVPRIRIPGAVDISDTYQNEVSGSPETDIAQDFWINSSTSPVNNGTGFLVQVPLGATHLFLGAADTQWFDNTNVNTTTGSYGISLTRLYEGRFLGDYNYDGLVDAADYVVWRKAVGTSGTDLFPDGNLDGIVNGSDYLIWRNHFGTIVPVPGSGSAISATIPEPNTIVFAVLAVVLALVTRTIQNKPL